MIAVHNFANHGSLCAVITSPPIILLVIVGPMKDLPHDSEFKKHGEYIQKH